jgi:hypothetical protein
VVHQSVKSEIMVNIDRFSNRLEFALTLATPENLPQSFVSHAVAAAAFRTVQQNAVLIEFAHPNKITHADLDQAAPISVKKTLVAKKTT